MKITEDELYSRITSKHPSYASLPKEELLPRIYSKYPQYKNMVSFDEGNLENASSFQMHGPLSRGIKAAEQGANLKDLPGLIARVVSDYFATAPENVLNNPMKAATAGLPGVQIDAFGEDEIDAFPQPPSEAGKKLADEIGMAASFAGAPGQAAMKVAPKIARHVPNKTLRATKEAVDKIRRGKDFEPIEKAQKLTTELLQPPKQELANYLNRGKQHPAVEQATKYIEKSKDFKDLRTRLDITVRNLFKRRKEILTTKNKPIGDYTKELSDLIREEIATGQAKKTDVNRMMEVLRREYVFIRKHKLDRLTGQDRKEKLQKITDKLLTKTEKGDIIDNDPARNRALDALRRGLKRTVEDGDDEIRQINETYGGLKRAKELAAGQESLVQKEIPPSLLEKFLAFIPRSSDIPNNVARMAKIRESSIRKTTRGISRLYKEAVSN